MKNFKIKTKRDWCIKEGAATIEIHFPIGVFVSVIAGVLILTSRISLVAVRRVKKVNVINMLK